MGQELESLPAWWIKSSTACPPDGSGAREPVPSGGSGAREPALPGGSGDREPVPPGLKRLDDLNTRILKSSHSHLPVVRAVSSLYHRGCDETNGNEQTEVASTIAGVVKLTGMRRQK